MFRAAYRLSSGALTVFAASGLHTHVCIKSFYLLVICLLPVALLSRNSTAQLSIIATRPWKLVNTGIRRQLFTSIVLR